MSRVLYSLVVFAVFAAVASPASAAIVFQDNFDGYADTAAFTAAWPVVGSQPTGTISTAQFVSSPNSVNISAGTTTTTSQRNGRSIPESGTVGIGDQLIWSYDFYDAQPALAPYRQFSNLQDGAISNNNQLVSMGLNNNQSAVNSGGQFYMARILGYTVPLTPDPDGGPAESVGGAGAYFKLNDFSTGTGTGPGARGTTAGWHSLKVIITTDDGLSTDYAFYVDGQLAERVSNVGGPTEIRSYDSIRIGSGVSSTAEAFYDNMLVEFVPVPEPTAMAAMGLVAMGLMRRRRSA